MIRKGFLELAFELAQRVKSIFLEICESICGTVNSPNCQECSACVGEQLCIMLESYWVSPCQSDLFNFMEKMVD